MASEQDNQESFQENTFQENILPQLLREQGDPDLVRDLTTFAPQVEAFASNLIGLSNDDFVMVIQKNNRDGYLASRLLSVQKIPMINKISGLSNEQLVQVLSQPKVIVQWCDGISPRETPESKCLQEKILGLSDDQFSSLFCEMSQLGDPFKALERTRILSGLADKIFNLEDDLFVRMLGASSNLITALLADSSTHDKTLEKLGALDSDKFVRVVSQGWTGEAIAAREPSWLAEKLGEMEMNPDQMVTALSQPGVFLRLAQLGQAEWLVDRLGLLNDDQRAQIIVGGNAGEERYRRDTLTAAGATDNDADSFWKNQLFEMIKNVYRQQDQNAAARPASGGSSLGTPPTPPSRTEQHNNFVP